MSNLSEILINWEKLLESYGTPGNFADNTLIHILENSNNREDIPLRVVVSPGFLSRRDLMEKQSKESEERKSKNLTPRWLNDENSCFLCDNVGQAKDIGNNLALPWDTLRNYILVPNRYAMMRGHFLLCAKNHNATDKLPNLTADYISTAVELSEKYGLIFLRNHPKAGMSILWHEHGHLHPRNLKTDLGEIVSLNGLVGCRLIPTDFGESAYSIEKTRFDTLAIRGEDSLDILIKIANRLNSNNIIFTFAYEPKREVEKGTFFITPHLKDGAEKMVASKDPLYFCIVKSKENITCYDDFIKPSLECTYKKGEFPWKQFFD